MFNRWVESELLDVLAAEGAGCIAYSPLAQGLLTDRYLTGIPDDSRVRTSRFLNESDLTPQRLTTIRALNDVAGKRGQSLAQMALAWALRDPRMTSVVIGASSVNQLENGLGALSTMDFTGAELAQIDEILAG
jgi:L-glyceraldehyde 3-phosphate reductase